MARAQRIELSVPLRETTRVRRPVRGRLLQEVSQAHWNNLTHKRNILEKGLWLVRSHKIEYKNLTKLNDKIIISTYVKNVKGYLSERSVIIKLKKTNKILVKCLTEWCFVDLKTQKLKKIPQEIIKLFNNIN